MVAQTQSAHNLSAEHQRMLYRDSAISPDVAAARGYRTITNRAQLPPAFPDWQRRCGLLIPTYSPDGETARHQLRPDKPIPRKKGKPPKYETPQGSRITLDVNPLMREEVRHGEAPLWITEGCKKVDALASRGEPAVGFIGVWTMAVPETKGTVPLPCWQHVRLRGRRVIIVFDADARTNPDVQEALRRAVRMLEGLGAVVLVVYLPEVNGDPKAGVDDYLAAGGTVEELRESARPYQPVDIGAERMSRDEQLRAGVSNLRARWQELPGSGPGECSARDVALQLVEAAPVGGKVVADGIRVVKSWGTLMLEAKVSRQTLAKALVRLEECGFLSRDNEGRERGQAGAFILRADVDHYGGKRAPGGGANSSSGRSGQSGLPPRPPRLRWSSPGSRPSRKTISKYRRGEIERLPEPRPAIKRLGKIRGAILDVLDLSGGGSATLQEIAEALQRKRARDIRRRLLPWLIDDGIVTVDGDRVNLTADWQERLGLAMWAAEEPEADAKDRSALKVRREAFHNRRKREQTPRASLDAMERGRQRRAAAMMQQAGHVSELEPVPEVSPELKKALRFYLERNQYRPEHCDTQRRYAAWLAGTLWCFKYIAPQPTTDAVELALTSPELSGVAA
jgi:Domain of unknown function (DUF3854)